MSQSAARPTILIGVVLLVSHISLLGVFPLSAPWVWLALNLGGIFGIFMILIGELLDVSHVRRVTMFGVVSGVAFLLLGPFVVRTTSLYSMLPTTAGRVIFRTKRGCYEVTNIWVWGRSIRSKKVCPSGMLSKVP